MDDAGQDRANELTLQPVTVGAPRRRRALWGVLVATMTAAAALSVVSAGDDSDPGRLPVALGAVARAEASGAADARFAAVTYVPGDGLPALGGSARAYRLTGTVDEAAVERLANALGLAAAPVHEGTTWRVAEPNGGLLEVSEGYGAMWWYTAAGGGVVEPGSSGGGGVESCYESSDDVVTDCAVRPTTTVVAGAACADEQGAADCAVTCVTAEPGTPCDVAPPVDCAGGPADDTGCFPARAPLDCAVSSDGSTTCPEPEPAADLPSEAEARQIALDVLAATGMDVDGAIIRADGPYDAWYVSVEPRIDGVPSSLFANVSVGSGGLVRDASGFLGAAEDMGDYPVLDTRAAIERANHQQVMPMAGDDSGSPAVGSGESEPVTTHPADAGVASDPVCTDDERAALRCGDELVDPPDTTVPACKVQPDGREICETEPSLPPCPQAAPGAEDPALGAPEVPGCTPPLPEPVPLPEPEPFEVVLVDAQPALVLLAANDGSTDAYLVPAYRFTAEDGSTVDLPAVSDDALAPEPAVTTPPDPPVTPLHQPACQVLVEEDESGTTHTVAPPPDCVDSDSVELPAGEEPVVGVGYYADVNVLDGHCTWISVEVGGRWWWAEMPPGSLAEWSTPTEGGTFTLLDSETAEFVGDAARTKTAILTPFGDGTEQPICN